MNGIEKIPVTSENGDSLNVTGFGAQQKVELGNYTKEVSMDISPVELERELIPQSVSILIQRLIANREKLANIGLGLGLNPAYLELLNSQPLQVGFGEQNFPLPTLFPDGVGEMKESFGVSEAIKIELKSFGLDSTLNSLLTLKWDSFVSSGYAACDYILLPKNEKENKKVTFLGSKEERKSLGMVPYGLIEITQENFSLAKQTILETSMGLKSKRRSANAEPVKISKLEKKLILEALIQDIDDAFEQSGVSYYNFITALNQKIVLRATGKNLPITEADPNLQNFLRNGLSDPSRFFEALLDLGFPLGPGIKSFKMIGPKNKMVSLCVSSLNPVRLFYAELEEEYNFAELVKNDLLFPTKDLAYLFEMSGLLPQIYLDDNQIVYEPYFLTLRVLNRLGLEPVIFPYRERKQIDSNKAVTIFDFYAYILNTEV